MISYIWAECILCPHLSSYQMTTDAYSVHATGRAPFLRHLDQKQLVLLAQRTLRRVRDPCGSRHPRRQRVTTTPRSPDSTESLRDDGGLPSNPRVSAFLATEDRTRDRPKRAVTSTRICPPPHGPARTPFSTLRFAENRCRCKARRRRAAPRPRDALVTSRSVSSPRLGVPLPSRPLASLTRYGPWCHDPGCRGRNRLRQDAPWPVSLDSHSRALPFSFRHDSDLRFCM